MHLGQAETVVGRAVADLLAMHAGEGDLDLPPTAETVGKVDGPALGIIPGRTGVAIVEHIDEKGRSAAPAVQPEGDPFVGAPVLADPRVHRRVLERVDDAGVGDDVHVQFQHTVGNAGVRDRGRGRRAGRDRYRRTRVCIVERIEADRVVVGVFPGPKPGFEIVDDRQASGQHGAHRG